MKLVIITCVLTSFALAQAPTPGQGGSGGSGVSSVTNVTATSPIVSSGGTTPAISCPTCSTTSSVNVTVLISTSGPVTDPAVPYAFQFNNASGALTFNAPSGVAGYQRCYKNATGKSGVITIQMATSNTVDVGGTNGASAGTLVSSGAAGDALCIVSDATNHWYAYINSGSWTNN